MPTNNKPTKRDCADLRGAVLIRVDGTASLTGDRILKYFGLMAVR